MQAIELAESLLLSDLKFLSARKSDGGLVLECASTQRWDVCRRCASVTERLYDHRYVNVRDRPLHGHKVVLRIKKRRFKCTCGSVFTEHIDGIRFKGRTTERFRRHCIELARNFLSLCRVSQVAKCSHGYVQNALYSHLRIKTRHHQQQTFPKSIGLDEHSFKRGAFGRMEFVTMVTSPKGKRRLLDMAYGKSTEQLWEALRHHKGREDVQLVVTDMSKAYRKFVREFFPNATLVADKFHVIRLLSHVVMKYRYAVTAKRASRATRAKLLADFTRLKYEDRFDLKVFLSRHQDLHSVWEYYQAVMRLYRTRGIKKATRAFYKLLERLKTETLPELKRFRRTLREWRAEILAYFEHRITNARCEGFNNKAKVLKKAAYGYKSFENYRLRTLTA